MNCFHWDLPLFDKCFYPLLLINNVKYLHLTFSCVFSDWFSSVTQSRQTLCDPMDCRMPGFPVNQLPGFTQTHVHVSTELVMTSNHLIQPSHPLLFPSPPTFNLSQQQGLFQWKDLHWKVSSSHSILRIRWPKYWSFSFSISPFNEHPGLIPLGRTGWISLQSKGLSRVFSNTIVQKHQFFGTQLSSQSNSHIHTWPLEKP